jgi:hypothetical protein
MTSDNLTRRRYRALPLIAGVITLGAIGLATVPAEARIRCNGNYQIVDGNQIATPYCQDENLARVAREYGMRVSGSQIRASESKKAEACRLAGNDNRVSVACASYRLDPDFRRKF